MDKQKYLNERLEDQINWYDKKSMHSQRTFKWLKGIEIIIASFVPIASLGFNQPWLAAIMGASIAIIEGLLNLGKYHENWIEYRSICETLKHEKYMYQTKTGVYNTDECTFKYLVERIESIISKENVNWANMNRQNTRRDDENG